MPHRIAILKTGSTYPVIQQTLGDFEHWFLGGLSETYGDGIETQVIRVSDGEQPGAPADWDGVVVTGSPAMVSDREAWSEQTAAWLREAVAAEVPLLGVCYGHQLLAHAFGGTVADRPQGRESGTFNVRLTAAGADDPLLGALPSDFPAHLTHQQSVLTLPAEAVVLACSDNEAHQAIRIGSCAWGVQFHPEFSAAVMTEYLKVQAPTLRAAGQDVESLIAGVSEAAAATSLLRRFAALVTG